MICALILLVALSNAAWDPELDGAIPLIHWPSPTRNYHHVDEWGEEIYWDHNLQNKRITAACGKEKCKSIGQASVCDHVFATKALKPDNYHVRNLKDCPTGYRNWGYCKKERAVIADQFLRTCISVNEMPVCTRGCGPGMVQRCDIAKSNAEVLFERDGTLRQCTGCRGDCIGNKGYFTPENAYSACENDPRCAFVQKETTYPFKYYLRRDVDNWKGKKGAKTCKQIFHTCRLAKKESHPHKAASVKLKFKLMEKGKLCAQNEYITNLQVCKDALSFVKKTVGTALDGTENDRAWGHRPFGCFLHVGGTVGLTKKNAIMFNRDPNRGKAHKDDRQVCVQVEDTAEEELAKLFKALFTHSEY